MRIILMELKHTIWSIRFLVAILIGNLILIASVSNEIYVASQRERILWGVHNTLFDMAMGSELAMLGMAVICSLPFATTFIQDVKSKFLIFRLVRSNSRDYILSKIFTAYFVGGLTVLLSAILFYCTLLIAFVPVEVHVGLQTISVNEVIKQFSSIVEVYFFVGGFFSLAAMVLGSLSMNYYIAYASSFILFYLLVILHQRYVRNFQILDPQCWILSFDKYPYGKLGVAIISIALSALLGVAFSIFAKRRIQVE